MKLWTYGQDYPMVASDCHKLYIHAPIVMEESEISGRIRETITGDTILPMGHVNPPYVG